MWRNQRGREFVLVAKNDGFGDEGIVLKRVLDRLGSNKFSTRSFDQIFLSVGDREKAVFIQIPDITGLEPAIHKCILSFIWFVPITLEYRWASYQDFAIFSDADLHVFERSPTVPRLRGLRGVSALTGGGFRSPRPFCDATATTGSLLGYFRSKWGAPRHQV